MRSFPESVLDVAVNVMNRPAGSRFFLGETVLHNATNEMYTVCDLGHYEQDYYGLWPVGKICAIPTHGALGAHLSSISIAE